MRIVHLTDAHLSHLGAHTWFALTGKRRLGYLSWWRKRRHQMQAAVLERITQSALALAPDIIAVTGDLVHLGLADEIEQAAQWLARLSRATRVILVPGNHDCYQSDACPRVATAWRDALGADATDERAYPHLHVQDDVAVIALNSARPMPFWSAEGELGTAQLARLDTLLGTTAGQLRCVLLHHPPAPGLTSARKALRDAPALAALLEAHGVELVLHGHLHVSREHREGSRTAVFVTAAASSGTATAPGALRVFDIRSAEDGWQVAVGLHEYAPASAALRVRAATHWQFAPR